MKTKKVFSVVAVGALTLALAACGASPKESFIETSKKTSDMTSFKVVSDAHVKFDLSKMKSMTSKNKKEAADLEKSEITVTQVVDQKNKKYEVLLHGKYDSQSIDIPVLVDEKNQKVYIKFVSLLKLNPSFKQQVEPALGGKTTLEIDVKELNKQLPKEKQLDLNKNSLQSVQKVVSDELVKFLDKKDEKSFTKEDDAVKVIFSKNDIKTLSLNISQSVAKKLQDKALSKDEKKELENELNKSFKDVKVNEISSAITEDDGTIKSNKIVVDVTVTNPDNSKEKLGVKVTVDNTYSDVNGKVKFTFSPAKDKLLTTDELMALYMQAFSASMNQSLE